MIVVADSGPPHYLILLGHIELLHHFYGQVALRVTGTLGVLRAGAEQGIVDVPDTVSKLRATSFYVDDALINAIFARGSGP